MRGKPLQQIGARLVEEVDVFDDEQQRAVGKHGREEARRHVDEHVAQETSVELACLLRRRQIETEEDAEQRYPGLELGSLLAATSRSRAPASTSVLAPSSRSERIGSRSAKYGVEASYSSQTARKTRTSVASSTSSVTRRDLPRPAEPLISTTDPVPDLSSSRAVRSAASSASRPTSGVSPWRSPRLPVIGPDDRRSDLFCLSLGPKRLDRSRRKGRSRAVQHD